MSEFPDDDKMKQKQKLAICYSQWKNKKKKTSFKDVIEDETVI